MHLSLVPNRYQPVHFAPGSVIEMLHRVLQRPRQHSEEGRLEVRALRRKTSGKCSYGHR